MTIVAKLLTDARWKLRLQQNEVAAASGLSNAYVCDLMAGRRGLSVRAAKSIAPILKLNARKLLIAQLDEELLKP
jgi:cyanate lyase